MHRVGLKSDLRPCFHGSAGFTPYLAFVKINQIRISLSSDNIDLSTDRRSISATGKSNAPTGNNKNKHLIISSLKIFSRKHEQTLTKPANLCAYKQQKHPHNYPQPGKPFVEYPTGPTPDPCLPKPILIKSRQLFCMNCEPRSESTFCLPPDPGKKEGSREMELDGRGI